MPTGTTMRMRVHYDSTNGENSGNRDIAIHADISVHLHISQNGYFGTRNSCRCTTKSNSNIIVRKCDGGLSADNLYFVLGNKNHRVASKHYCCIFFSGPFDLLSGGERALTAIALLFAILKLKPTAFCILDEIESALDDANVTNFAEYVRNYSDDTQFILITHRKGSMAVCDSLYGVAMEERGVSKVVSAKFTESA
mgnify:CR=1 FL=1